jgi:hypothetical protein
MMVKEDRHSIRSVLDRLEVWLGLKLLYTTSKSLQAPLSVNITACHHDITQPSGLLYLLTHFFE